MNFSTTIAGAAHLGAAPAASPARPTTGPDGPASTHAAKGKLDAATRFEAMVMQTLIGEMLPKNATHVFGKGTAGDVWKSLLSQQLAETMAARHQFGFAAAVAPKAVEATGPIPASTTPPETQR